MVSRISKKQLKGIKGKVVVTVGVIVGVVISVVVSMIIVMLMTCYMLPVSTN